jgi:hypothetical protein
MLSVCFYQKLGQLGDEFECIPQVCESAGCITYVSIPIISPQGESPCYSAECK